MKQPNALAYLWVRSYPKLLSSRELLPLMVLRRVMTGTTLALAAVGRTRRRLCRRILQHEIRRLMKLNKRVGKYLLT